MRRLSGVGADVSRQFALRAVVNLFIAAGMTILLFALGVDAPLLWGILTFFLDFIPYIGIYIATVPGVVLALAQYGLVRALLVIAGVVVLNLLAENGLDPATARDVVITAMLAEQPLPLLADPKPSAS